MPDARITWQGIDKTARGPREPVIVGPSGMREWVWGRTWNPQPLVQVAPMPDELSAEAIRIVADPHDRGQVLLTTRQGSQRDDVRGFGHLEVFAREGGHALHRMTGRLNSWVVLPAGEYRLDLSLDDPYCSVDLVVGMQAPRQVPAAAAGGLTGHWPLETYFAVPDDPRAPRPHLELAVSLLALAAREFEDLRGGRTPNDFFEVLLRKVLDISLRVGGLHVRATLQRNGITVPKGSDHLTEVARYRRSKLEPWQLNELHAHLRALRS